ncbi:MAG TPA: DNA-binding protein, partial [Cupriavidus sp.]|nr:DNA-binding protein [Cupriavidus sp.]
DLDTVRIGQPVRIRFSPSEDGAPVPTFAPA